VSAVATRRFRFVQVELPGSLGPPDGRYPLRPAPGAAPDAIVVLATLGAPRPARRRAGRGRAAPPEPTPTVVPVTRVTAIDAAPLPDERAAGAWLDAQRAAPDLDWALRAMNRLAQAHRIAAADPDAHELTLEQSLSVRLGFGRGDEVADGRWEAAWEVPVARLAPRRRLAALRPQERLAGLLAGRDAALVCEELALRARLDLDRGRGREGALALRDALEAAVEELSDPALASRVEELRAQLPAVRAAARTALAAPLDDLASAALEHALGRLQAALRARTAGGVPEG